MGSWKIYSKSGVAKATVKSLEYTGEFMGETYVTVSISSPAPIDFVIGDYLDYRGERFTLYNVPSELKQARKDSYGAAFVYDSIKFESLSYELVNCQFLDVVKDDNNIHYTKLSEFTFYASSVSDLADRLKANLDRLYTGTSAWTVNVDSSVEDESKNISISNITCWDALALANSEWDLNFTIKGRTITIGAAGISVGSVFQYGKGNGLLSLQRTSEDNQGIITRLRAYGSTKNLPSHYYAYLNSKAYFDATTVEKSDSWIMFTLGESTFPTTCFTVNADDPAYPLEKRYLVTYELDGVSCKGMFVKPDTGNEWAVASTAFDTFENVAAFIAKYDAGNTRVYITKGINKTKVPDAQIDRGTSTLPNNYSVTHLMLPMFPAEPVSDYYEYGSTDAQDPYIDSPNISELGVLEGTVYFDGSGDLDEIYPSIENSELNYLVSAEQITDNGIFEEGDTIEDFEIVIPNIGFDINDYKSTENASISFTSGKCTGREFVISSCSQNDDGTYTLKLQRLQDTDLDLYFPYKDYNLAANDTFVLLNIYMPDEYVEAASMKLLEAAKEYLAENDYTRYTYEPKIDNIYIQREYDSSSDKTKSIYYTLKEGQLLQFSDTDLEINGSIFIDTLSIKEGSAAIPEFEVTLREDKQVGTIQKIQNAIDSLTSGGSAASVDISQIRSLCNSLYLSKKNDDTAQGNIAFAKNITVGGDVTFSGTVQSSDYTEGALGTGSKLGKYGTSTDSYLEVDRLLVRKIAEFIELQIDKISHVGGQIILTPASIEVSSVEETDDAYRCYFETDDGEKTITNDFKVGDQARCQSFNIASGTYENVSNSYYWRLVTAVGENYIDLSKTDCDTGSTVPQRGDNVVLLGSRGTDTSRQNAIMISAYGDGSPYIAKYSGITTYSLSGCMVSYDGFENGKQLLRQYGSFYFGDKGADAQSYIKYDNVTEELEIKAARLLMSSGDNIEDAISTMSDTINDVKSQTDKEYTIWFTDEAPTADNEPEKDWTTDEEKAEHEYDICYVRSLGKAWRYLSKAWVEITDADTISALEKVKKRARVFVTGGSKTEDSPAPPRPYSVGDQWCNVYWRDGNYDSDGNPTYLYEDDQLVCITPKAEGEDFSIDDWRPSNWGSKRVYEADKESVITAITTDYTKADADILKQAKEEASNAKDAAEKDIKQLKTDLGFPESGEDTSSVVYRMSVQEATADHIINAVCGYDASGNIVAKSSIVMEDEFTTLFSQHYLPNSAVLMTSANITTYADAVGSAAAVETKYFNTDGTLKNKSGMVTSSESDSSFASLFAEYLSNDGTVQKKAEMKTYVQKNDDGTLESGVTINADNVNFSGHKISLSADEISVTSDAITINNKALDTYISDFYDGSQITGSIKGGISGTLEMANGAKITWNGGILTSATGFSS